MSVEITPVLRQQRCATAEPFTAAWGKMLAVYTLLTLLGLAGGMLAWRRLAGALCEPLDAWALATTAIVLATAGLAVRVLGRSYANAGKSSRLGLAALILFGPTVAIVFAAYALSLPSTSVAGLTMLWGVLASGELLGLIVSGSLVNASALTRGLRFDAAHNAPASSPLKKGATAGLSSSECRNPRENTAGQASSGTQADKHLLFQQAARAVEQVTQQADTVFEEPTCDETPDTQVTQQLVRLQELDGTESMSGWLRASFLPGQRTTSVHLAFCPPFASTPVVEVEQTDGPLCRIKTVQLLPYGVRFDLKLSEDAEEALTVLLQFSARV